MVSPGEEIFPNILTFLLGFQSKKLRVLGGRAPEKKTRFCKVLSIIFIIETKAKKGHAKCSWDLNVKR